MDWQPIETAPKDGSRVLVVSGEEYHVASWHGDNGYGLEWFNDEIMVPATHWMPLPSPPELK